MTKGCGAEGEQQKCLVKSVGYCLGGCCVFVGGGLAFWFAPSSFLCVSGAISSKGWFVFCCRYLKNHGG